jgi:hypothetical protein
VEDSTVAWIFLLDGHPGRCLVPNNIIVFAVAVELDHFFLTFLLLLADVDVPDEKPFELVHLMHS